MFFKDSWRTNLFINQDSCAADISGSPDDTTYDIIDPYDETCWTPFSDTATKLVTFRVSFNLSRKKHLYILGQNIRCGPFDGITVLNGKRRLCMVEPHPPSGYSNGLQLCAFTCGRWIDTYLISVTLHNESHRTWKICKIFT